MSALRAVVVGAGRLAGGFVAPVLRAAGWEVVLACRDVAVRAAIDESGGLWVRLGAAPEEWVDGVRAAGLDDPALASLILDADLLATSVGPAALGDVGRWLAPLLRARVDDRSRRPLNVVTFENHRRAPELLAGGLFETAPSLASELARRFAIGGAAVWRIVARREHGPDGLRFHANDVRECYVDAGSLLPGLPPLDGSVPGVTPVSPFEDRIVEKLWVFNAGHAAAAYLGWHAGCATVHEAMARAEIRAQVRSVVVEAQTVFTASSAARSDAARILPRPAEWILDRYADPELVDPIVRVGREPRRKLAAGDRLMGPAVALIGLGTMPRALATAAAAALAFAAPTDAQAMDLQRELALVGPEEVLAGVATLDPSEELTRLVCARYRELASQLVVA